MGSSFSKPKKSTKTSKEDLDVLDLSKYTLPSIQELVKALGKGIGSEQRPSGMSDTDWARDLWQKLIAFFEKESTYEITGFIDAVADVTIFYNTNKDEIDKPDEKNQKRDEYQDQCNAIFATYIDPPELTDEEFLAVQRGEMRAKTAPINIPKGTRTNLNRRKGNEWLADETDAARFSIAEGTVLTPEEIFDPAKSRQIYLIHEQWERFEESEHFREWALKKGTGEKLKKGFFTKKLKKTEDVETQYEQFLKWRAAEEEKEKAKMAHYDYLNEMNEFIVPFHPYLDYESNYNPYGTLRDRARLSHSHPMYDNYGANSVELVAFMATFICLACLCGAVICFVNFVITYAYCILVKEKQREDRPDSYVDCV